MVVNSRKIEPLKIRRRRECEACHERFTTLEIVHETPPVVKSVRYLKNKRAHLRRMARKEAQQTLEPVELIYARWGVS
jgi:transcriptional regulator NrdR family protein